MSLFSLNGIKTFRGMEDQGLNANLLCDGTKVALILDEGCGGEMRIDFLPKFESIEKDFFAQCAAWWETSSEKPRWEKDGLQASPQDKAVCWVNEEVCRIEDEKRFKRIAKTKTLFRVKGDTDGEWRTIKGPYTPEVGVWIRNKYGDKVENIFGVSP